MCWLLELMVYNVLDMIEHLKTLRFVSCALHNYDEIVNNADIVCQKNYFRIFQEQCIYVIDMSQKSMFLKKMSFMYILMVDLFL